MENPTQYLLYDGHGSTRQLVSPSQTIVDSYSYDAYGVMLGNNTNPNPAQTAATSLLYAGEQYDTAMQHYYLRARCYNPANGLFNQTDPYAGNTQDPQSLHKYTYCHNNPVNGIDPTGMFFSLGGLVLAVAIRGMFEGIRIGIYTSAMSPYAERIYGHASDLNFLAREKEHANATIIVHGIAPHDNGWSNEKGFIDELEARASNQDYYEFTWSGFTLTGTFGINRGVHDVATNNLIRAVQIVQQKGYSKVNIISHSWGTVLSRDAQQAGVGNINTWVTMGSPLNADTRKYGTPHWMNFYSKGDLVVTLFPHLLGLTGVQAGAGCLYNNSAVDVQQPVSGGHTSYWTNQMVLDMIGNRLSSQ